MDQHLDRAIRDLFRRDYLITVVAGITIVLGFILLILGVTGSIDFGFEFKKVNANLVNASPGVVFAMFGFAVLGAQTYFRPNVKAEIAGGTKLELHESGPVFLFPTSGGLHLHRNDRQPPLGDHYYGDPIDQMIDGLSVEPVDREPSKTGPVTVKLRLMQRERIEEALGPLVDEWVQSAQLEGQEGRTVQINVGGKWAEYQFVGGHLYDGCVRGRQLGPVISFLTLLSKASVSA
jgi:hypothetical protein